jgi:hypothetical protein
MDAMRLLLLPFIVFAILGLFVMLDDLIGWIIGIIKGDR